MKKNVNKNKYNFEPSRSTAIKLWWRSLLLFVSLFSIFFSHAEQFPVHITPQLISPYSLQLNDYYNGTNAKLMVTLINKDLLKPTISVRLRMSIASQSAKLTSKDYVYYPPIVLDAGIPLQLSLSYLAPYFNPDNLNFEGITRAQYQQQGKLPEGFYQFCFEAIEISTNQAVSLKKCASAWISLSDPPLLNLPRKAESVVFREPTNIIFNWTPRHLNSPNSAFNTEYDFQLVELWDNGIDPVAAFQTAQPLYQTTLNATTLLYGPGEPPLIPGKKYGWRVKAKAKSGIDDVDVFRNNGFSEVFWLTYQDNCQPPTNVTATVQNGRATLTWMPQPQMFEYTIEYREASPNGGGAGVQWFSQKTNATQTTIYDAQAGKTYEYRIGGSCSIGGGIVFGDPKAFTIPFRNTTRDSACGILPNINIANQTPLQTLVAGDVVLAGDFPVKLLQVSGMASFTGNGYVTVPFLGQARVKVKFNNIGVNTDNQLISGVIETTFDSTMKGIYDLDPIFEGGGNVGFVKSGADTANYTVDFVIGLPQDTVAIIPATDGKGGYIITIKGNNGNDYHLPVDSLPATIKDKDGNIYQIDKNGNLIPIGKPADLKGMTAAQLNNLATQKAVVKFVANPSQQYAFDEWKPVYDKSALWSEKYEKLSEGYRVNAKAIEAGKTDKVNAVISITDNTIKPENIKFITGKGTELTYKRNNNEYEINIIGGPAGDAQELYALYPDGDKYISLGKLLIASYQHQKKKLKLVPVNGTDIDESTVAAKLNEIYNKVGVEWEVSQDNNFDDHSWDANNNGLDIDGSGLLSTLTPEMKALNKAYKNSGRDIDDKTIYLFVLDKAAGQANIAGDMPRAKQFGYLFTNSGADLGSTAAHEVGHGVFHLKHTFDGYGFAKNELPENVMDYSNGNAFSKLQWDALHDPGVVVGVFEKDEDGESVTGYYSEKGNSFISLTGTKSFLTPAGLPITIDKLAEVAFVTAFPAKIPSGALVRFKLSDGKQYVAQYDANLTKFEGYVLSSNNNEKYIDAKLIIQNEIYLGYPDACNVTLYTINSNKTFQLSNNTISQKIDFSDKTKVGENYDPEACLKTDYAKNLLIECSTKVIDQSYKADCYTLAKMADNLGDPILKIYGEVYGVKDDYTYTQGNIKNLYNSLYDFYIDYQKSEKEISTITNCKNLIAILRSWTTARFEALKVDQRIHTLKILTGCTLSDSENWFAQIFTNEGGENVVLKILETTMGKDNIKQLLSGIANTKNSNDVSIISALYDKMNNAGFGDDNLDKMSLILWSKFNECGFSESSIGLEDVYYAGTYSESNNFENYSEGPLNFSTSLHENGTAEIQQNYIFKGASVKNGITILEEKDNVIFKDPKIYNAFDPVGLVFLRKPDQSICPQCVENKLYVVPAYFVNYFTTERWKSIIKKSTFDGLQLFGVAYGVGQFNNASKIMKVLLALETVVNASDYIVSNPNIESKISQTKEGTVFLWYWRRAVIATNVLSFSPVAYKWFNGAIDKYKAWRAVKPNLEDLGEVAQDLETNMKKLEDWEMSVKYGGGVVTGAGNLADDFINGLLDANKYIQEGKFVPNVKKIDLMGGKTSQLGGDFANIDLQATKGINGDASKLSQYIQPNSIDEIIVSNPFPTAPFAGPKEFFLTEASKVMKPGTTLTINGEKANKFFKNVKAGSIEDLGFEIVEFQVPLKLQFQNMKFYQVNGVTPIQNSNMFTTIIRKK